MLDFTSDSMSAGDGTGGSPGDLASLFAAMDARLRALKGELDAVMHPPAPSPKPPHRPTHPAPAAPQPEGGSLVAARDAHAAIRATLLAAEQEARDIVEDAQRRIAEIAARTRALLEQRPSADPTDPPDPGFPSRAHRFRSGGLTDEHEYVGEIAVEAGPFASVAALNGLEAALVAVPGVADVHIATFERYYARFDVRIDEPVALIAELRARVAGTLQVVEMTEGGPRLEILSGT